MPMTVSTSGTDTIFTNTRGKLFRKYRNVFVKAILCISGKRSGLSIRHKKLQISLPPIDIVTIFQSYLKLTRLSFLMRLTSARA